MTRAPPHGGGYDHENGVTEMPKDMPREIVVHDQIAGASVAATQGTPASRQRAGPHPMDGRVNVAGGASFELKPMGSTNQQVPANPAAILFGAPNAMAAMIPKIEEIVWTNGRTPVPMLLAGRVPDDVWASTFDSVYARTAEDIASAQETMENFHRNATGGLPMIPCCVPCIIMKQICGGGMRGHMQKAMAQQQAWVKLAQNEQQKYSPYNVTVTFAQEMRTSSSLHDHGHRSHMVTVGLKFDVGAAPSVAPTAVVAQGVIVSAPPMGEMVRDPAQPGSVSVSVSDELAKLSDLRKTGAIDDDEFAAAKAKVLGKV